MQSQGCNLRYWSQFCSWNHNRVLVVDGNNLTGISVRLSSVLFEPIRIIFKVVFMNVGDKYVQGTGESDTKIPKWMWGMGGWVCLQERNRALFWNYFSPLSFRTVFARVLDNICTLDYHFMVYQGVCQWGWKGNGQKTDIRGGELIVLENRGMYSLKTGEKKKRKRKI